jgi:hypothetical protein
LSDPLGPPPPTPQQTAVLFWEGAPCEKGAGWRVERQEECDRLVGPACPCLDSLSSDASTVWSKDRNCEAPEQGIPVTIQMALLGPHTPRMQAVRIAT